jgi:hypothetical protein
MPMRVTVILLVSWEKPMMLDSRKATRSLIVIDLDRRLLPAPAGFRR